MTQWYVTQQTIKQLVDVVNWEHEVLKLLPVQNYLY